MGTLHPVLEELNIVRNTLISFINKIRLLNWSYSNQKIILFPKSEGQIKQ